MWFKFFILCFAYVSFVESLDLLGLSLSVPALESDVNLGNVLGSKGNDGTTRNQPPPATRTTSKPTSSPLKCRKSVTTVNGGKSVCGGTIIFEEHFNTAGLNLSNWIKDKYIPQEPDYEFVTYERLPQNCYMNRGYLNFKPTLREDPLVSNLDLTRGCTGKVCTMDAIGTIIPPIVSAKIRSKLSFLYGRIEIRAQLPRGDWIYPHLNLEPKENIYGDGYESGRMWIAYTRGNSDLRKDATGEQIGNSVLYSGAVLSAREPQRTHSVVAIPSTQGYGWSDSFHIYALNWSPAGISVEIDGVDQGFINPTFSNSGVPYANLWTTNMAPFDHEFVISLGVGVGGLADFPDGLTSNGKKKPWKNTSAKGTLLFHRAQNDWYPTWAGENSALKIDYVKVWSL